MQLHGCDWFDRKRIAGITLQALLVLILAACSSGAPAPRPTAPRATNAPVETESPTPTLVPTLTPTLTATSTPTLTPTPTPILLVQPSTPLPAEAPAITYENADQVSGLAEWYETSVTDMVWTPDGRLLAVSGSKVINFYDLTERQVRRTLYPVLEDIVNIAFAPSGRWLVAGSRRGSEKDGYVSGLELWLGPDWKPLGVMYGTDRGLIDMAFSPNNSFLGAAYAHPIESKNDVDLWITGSWTISNTLQLGLLQSIAFSGDGRYLAVSPDRYAIRIYDLVDKMWLFDIHTSFTGAVNTMVFAPDGFTLATGHYDGQVNLWDVRDGIRLVSFKTEEVIQSLAFSPDGRIVVTGGSFQNNNVRLWGAGAGNLVRTLEGHTRGVTNLIFSPDSQYLVSASYDGMLRVWGIRP